MKITEKDVLHIAKLANLNLEPEEVTKFTNDLGAIINFADALSEINTDNIKETFTNSNTYNVFRKDEVIPSFEREKILQNTTNSKYGCFFVPKVVSES